MPFAACSSFFLERSAKFLRSFGLLLYAIPNAILILAVFSAEKMFPGDAGEDPVFVRKAIEVYSSGNFRKILSQNIEDWVQANGAWGLAFSVFMIFPLFLLGMSLAKEQVFENIAANRKYFRKLALIAVPSGLFFKTIPYFSDRQMAALYFQDLFGGPLLALGYMALGTFRFGKIGSLMSLVGRMPLSNYLFQTLVCVVLFYSYGFGYYGEFSYGILVLIAAAIFALQMLLSRIWLSRFTVGPAEWIWKMAAYRSIPEIKREIPL